MFKKSKQKIIVAIMAAMMAALAGTLVVIYAASYTEVYQKNLDMLELYIKEYFTGSGANIKPPSRPSLPEPRIPRDAALQLSTFYSVVFSEEAEVSNINNDENSPITADELTALAIRLVRSGKQRGTSGNFVYCIERAQGDTIVVLMDNTILTDSFTTLFRNTLLFGGCMLVLFFFCSLYLANRIVAPLEESYQKQKQFISDAGHELKTPIAVISANAEMLGRECGESKWLSNINFENERMAELVGQLLELAKTEHITPVMAEMDLSQTVTGGVLPFESVAFEHGLTLDCDIEEGLRLSGNVGQLGQLVSILVDNAILHADPGTAVTVSLKRERRSAVLSVANVGGEIPPEQREQIFERFYRGDRARSGGSGRYGLGLAIAKAIVLAHKGNISVTCKEGITKFSVSIPMGRS